MKRLFCLIMFIGMISITGFSATTDLTKNSKAELFADYDVGINNAIVAFSFTNNYALANETQVFTVSRDNEAINNYVSIVSSYQLATLRDNKPPDIHSKALTLNLNLTYRTARDAL